MLNAIKRRGEVRRCAGTLLAKLSAQARLPAFYEKFHVPDTIDGRFDLLVLHAWLVLERVREQKSQDLAQAIVDGLFIQFDEALRQQGAGDMAMGRRMTKMADAFYGRLKAYGDAKDTNALGEAIGRNVFRGDGARLEEAHALAIYASTARAGLKAQDLLAGAVEFGPLS